MVLKRILLVLVISFPVLNNLYHSYVAEWNSTRTNLTSYNLIYAAPLRAPKWYKRPVGASFGFGGKLVSFHAKAPVKGASGIPSEVGSYE